MVIQRWQSVLLLIAFIMMCLFSGMPLARIQGSAQTVEIYSFGIQDIPQGVNVMNTYYVAVVAGLATLLSALAIFMYKNTKLQKRVCLICILLTIAAVCSDYLVVNSFELPGATAVDFYLIFFLAPALSLLSLIGAWRCIRADERKLADADRLR